MKDVARHANVSVGTVSNVLNRPDIVSTDRRERVEAAIAELGYVRNDAARQLKLGQSRTVGAIVL
ncbi:MAG: LacI family DNA-binding transcriptional regulator, partial [Brachybacterium tyrofermentans]